VEKRLLDLPDPRVIVEVLGIDVGHHRHGGGELHERPVALVGLRHQKIPGPELGVGSEAVQLPPHDGCGVAVRSRDGDAVFHPHELGEHLRPGYDRDLPAMGLDHFLVIRPDGRGNDHHVDVVRNVAGGVPKPDLRTETDKPLRDVGYPQIRTGDAVA
jgi:hypothetical protein